MRAVINKAVTGLCGIVLGATLSFGGDIESTAKEFDLYPPEVLFDRAQVTRLIPQWTDYDTGFVSKRLIDLRFPIQDEDQRGENNKDMINYCWQNCTSPTMQETSPGHYIVFCYGSPKFFEGEPKMGDTLIQMEMIIQNGIENVVFKRNRESTLRHTPMGDESWRRIGSLGTGMDFVMLPEPTSGGWNFIGFANTTNGDLDEVESPTPNYCALTVSKDGKEWFFWKKGTIDDVTKDPKESEPLIDYEYYQRARNHHQAMFYSDSKKGGDGNVYIWFGQQNKVAGGINTYLMRFAYDKDHPFGVGDMQLWKNAQRGYSGEGQWIPFDGILDKYEMEHPMEYKYFWDSAVPHSITPLFNKEGKPIGMLYAYSSQNNYNETTLDFRMTPDYAPHPQTGNFRWGARKELGITEMLRKGYRAVTTSGIATKVFQYEDKLYALISISNEECFSQPEGTHSFRGARSSPGGLKLVQIQMMPSGKDFQEEVPKYQPAPRLATGRISPVQ